MRILFVNNDPERHKGLRNALKAHREQWKVACVAGPQAVRVLQHDRVDVVVADLDVEGPLGGSFIEMAAEEYPATIRVVLSEEDDPRHVMRVVPHAHQYLAHPVAPAELIHRIERSDALQALLHEDRVRRLGALNRLPTHHRIVDRLREALKDPDVLIEDVGRVIERDPAMSAKILQLVNSAFFARTRRVTHIRDAVSYLGLNIIEGLVLQIGLVSSFETLNGISLQRFQMHGLQVGSVARRIAPREISDVCFTAGLVHDVGKLVLALAYGAKFNAIAAAAEQGTAHAWRLERDAFGVSHPEAGAYILGVWGLPSQVVEGVAWHHHPDRIDRQGLDVVAAVHLADAIVCGEFPSKALVAELGLREKLKTWRRRFERDAA